MSLTRVTLTLDPRIAAEVRALSDGNFSRFVNSVLEERLEELRRQRLRDELRTGYEANADLDLEIANEYRFVDGETAEGEEN
ncbi:MAG: type II toxin-antitoxin system CcdA family antitoxin [Armatimonadetes bacterium]|nr:type II toxin-antitoxin system CcdA family antitoxin [Armatimonadota bacterium]